MKCANLACAQRAPTSGGFDRRYMVCRVLADLAVLEFGKTRVARKLKSGLKYNINDNKR